MVYFWIETLVYFWIEINTFKAQTGYGEGDYNISDITTSAPSGDYVGTDKLFVDGANGHKYYGAVKQGFWTGKMDVHISPYATSVSSTII